MGDTVDPITILQVGGPGVAMYRPAHFPNAPDPEITWLLRAESKMIRELPEQPVIGIRAGLLNVEQISLIPIVICAGSVETEGALFETWININQQGENPLILLANQNRIILQFYGDTLKLEKSISVPNSLREFAAELQKELNKRACDWTLSQFEAAKETMYRKFPDVKSLWTALG